MLNAPSPNQAPAGFITPMPVIHISDKAVEKIKQFLAAEKKDEGQGLRVVVKAGGCSGFSYDMKFDVAKETDRVFEKDGITVIVDSKSLMYIGGSTLDYVESLKSSSFTITNPNAKGTCGCGTSFTT